MLYDEHLLLSKSRHISQTKEYRQPFLLMRLKFQKRSALKFGSRIIPEAKRMGINDTSYKRSI